MNSGGFAAVVGTFDGVHRGHRYLLDDLRHRAVKAGLSTCVYTFTDHPLATLRPEKSPRLLSTVTEKLSLLDACAVDRIEIKPFGDVASMTARQYIDLLASNGVTLLVIGHDNRFGSDGLVTLEQFCQAAKGSGVTVEQAAELTTPDGRDINSSRIRQLLSAGHVTEANELLGYEYSMTGKVVKGKQLGRTIGFPTANIDMGPQSRKLIVPNGVYACRAVIGKDIIPAMVNIGHRPTVDMPDAPMSIEAHLIGYDHDLYDRLLSLQFVERLRDERPFPTLDALKTQLHHDRINTISALKPLSGL